MDLLDSLNILLRRWVLTLPLLILTGAGVLTAMAVLPWSYEAKATAVFLASPHQAKEAGGNPWLVFDGSLTVTAEVIGRELMDARTAAELRSRGLTAEYLVAVPPDTTGPVLQIDVTGEDQETTQATLAALMELVPEKLERIQADGGVGSTSRIKSRFVASTPQAELKATGKLRTVVLALFAGLAMTVAVPLFTESLLTRRRSRPRPEPDTPRPAAINGENAAEPEPPQRHAATNGTWLSDLNGQGDSPAELWRPGHQGSVRTPSGKPRPDKPRPESARAGKRRSPRSDRDS